VDAHDGTSSWRPLYIAGGVAALLAALLFRRNIGAEVSLFTGFEAIPQSVAGWYALLQERPFIGLSFLSLFDLANAVLVGVVFLALGAMLWRGGRSAVACALAAGLVGIAVALATNISLTMFALSRQYAAATSETQRAGLLAAGQAILAAHDPSAEFPSSGAYMSVLLLAVAVLLFAATLLRQRTFGRAAPVAGLLAGGCDLLYCLTIAFAPSVRIALLAAGGLFWMIWHLLVGIRLLRLSKGIT
jgi:hypothetical protein